jgi:hypothetical protein
MTLALARENHHWAIDGSNRGKASSILLLHHPTARKER